MHLVIHLLALFLVIVCPVWDYFETRPLRANPSRKGRMRYYRLILIWLWIATGIACLANGFSTLFTLGGLGINAAWLHARPLVWWLLVIFVILVVLVQLVLPVVQVSIKYRNRPYLEPRQLEPMRFFLPSSTLERRWFAALSVTAGFCEELLFRGFLLRYLHTWPLHIGFVWATLVAAVAFSANHLYQGIKGAVTSGIGALVFTAILLVTGSLWPGMLYHAAVDLSVLLYWRPKPEGTAA